MSRADPPRHHRHRHRPADCEYEGAGEIKPEQ